MDERFESNCKKLLSHSNPSNVLKRSIWIERELNYYSELTGPMMVMKLEMESGFEEPIRSFSRTPRKMSRDNGQFRTRTHRIASTGSNGEAKVSLVGFQGI